MSDAPLVFFDDSRVEPKQGEQSPWKIMVVDDDHDVHSVTEFVMHGVTILDRSLSFCHAYSAAEARELLAHEQDIAVILLDVVMESENAGLTLVKQIREELGLLSTRIILRTGQPGYAPEYEAIRDYDINDYRTKSELSYARLLTSLTAAIRSYVQIKDIAENSRGLEYIIQSAPRLLTLTSEESYASALIEQIGGIINQKFDAFVAKIDPHTSGSYEFLASCGKYKNIKTLSNDSLLPHSDLQSLEASLKSSIQKQDSLFGYQSACLYISGGDDQILCFYIELASQLVDQKRRMLSVFSVAAIMGYQNMYLMHRLRLLAYVDQATGLYNRTGFINAIDELETKSRQGLSVVLIDIEGFSEINEALGHDFGDDLLLAVARRLSSVFEHNMVVGRVSADGFALLGQEISLEPERISDIFAQPFAVQKNSMYLRVVFGLVRLGQVQGDGADIVKDAFIAVKIAKFQQQPRYCYYLPQLEVETRKKLAMLDALRHSLIDNRLELYYQPQVDTRDGALTGMEALMRWKTDDGVFIPPSTFIPLAEQSGLIVDMGNWVLNESCRNARRWLDEGLKPGRIAVNVSVRQFLNPAFLDIFADILKRHQLDESNFELEITESMAMHDVEDVLRILTDMKSRGYFIAIDDFGTGFSSLSYLQQLPIDRLKIDRSFVMAIHETERDRAIAGLIVGLGKSLGLSVIAEGVEHIQQSEILAALGCYEAQGYYYGKPMDSKAMFELLKSKV